MHLIEKILCKFVPFFDIGNETTGEVYLRRWFIYPRNPSSDKKSKRLYLHKFYRGDADRHLHDHPWSFTSLIIKGGYWEHRANPFYAKMIALGMAPERLLSEPTIRTWYGLGSYLKRGAKWTHRVELPEGKFAWTLVLTGSKERDWGFHTDAGWCWWRNYKEGVCWCYDTPEETRGTNNGYQKAA